MASLPVAGGTPSFASNEATGLTPKHYSTQLRVELYARTVQGEISNTDYEKDVSENGDKVVITGLPDVVESEYVPGQGLTYDTPEPTETILEINKARYWALSLNAVQRKQSHIAYGAKWQEHCARKMAIAVDTDFLANIYGEVAAANTGASAGAKDGDIDLGSLGAPLTLTNINVNEILVNCWDIMEQQNMPQEGRWVVFPPWAWARILTSDLWDASAAGDGTSILRNGKCGRVADFDIFKSNLLAKTADGSGKTGFHCIFGHKLALTFAAQMRIVESFTDSNDFGQKLRGLYVYGYKAVKPEGFGHLYISKT